MKEIKATEPLRWIGRSVFLAGSIEMGTAEKWQKKIVDGLKGKKVTVLNPRRDDWDSTWKQEITDKKFKEQVEWELKALELSGMVAMYFDPKSKSPISLLELGLYAESGKLVVCCPQGFWRKGNVDIVCEKYGVPLVNTLKELTEAIWERLSL